jgi:hypothetical protein
VREDVHRSDQRVGDVRTHREIYNTFIRPHLPADPIYVELGNFLTDVSQFRDPWAHVGGKAAAWRDGVSTLARLTLLADLFGVDAYLDLLLGRPDEDDPQGRRRVPHGKLAAWFREVIYAYALENTFRRHEAPHDYLIPPDEFKRLYDAHFTQYFPHEHVDFQPGPQGRLDDFSQSNVDATPGQRRRVVAYLDADIEYIGDLLTLIERDWARSDSLTPAEQRDRLVRLGHACHAVEDYFFHSNFVDLAHEIARPGQDVERFQPAETVDEHDPEGDRVPPPASVRWDRLYFRRKRRPIHGPDGETEFDDEASLAADLAFTASIPIPDIFHTFFDALGHLSEEQSFNVAPLVAQIVESCESGGPTDQLLTSLLALTPDQRRQLPLVLMSAFVPKEDETDEDREARDRAYRAYRCLAERDLLTRMFEHLASTGQVHRSVADAVARACDIEKELWSFLPGFLSDGTGAARFMITLLEQGREEVSRARERSEELDRINIEEKQQGRPPDQRKGYVPSDNGSSGERIGTHSLMSKDSVRKQPLRRQAINGAGFTVSYLVKTLVNQRAAGSPVEAGVDWYELLRHFLTHPDQAGPGPGAEWWRSALEWDRTEAGRPVEGHEPKPVPLAPGSQPEAARRARTIAERAAERRRGELVLLYNDLSEVGEERYRDAITTDWIHGSMVWSSLVGGISGLVGAGTDSAGTAVLGTLSGMAAGALAGAILSGVGTAISDRAGSVVGLLGALGAAGVGGFAVGRSAREF